jgi:hypothetical protein
LLQQLGSFFLLVRVATCFGIFLVDALWVALLDGFLHVELRIGCNEAVFLLCEVTEGSGVTWYVFDLLVLCLAFIELTQVVLDQLVCQIQLREQERGKIDIIKVGF